MTFEDDMSDEQKKDWRIGLTVKPKMRSHPRYYESGEVIEVHPSGTGGIFDKSGVLRIRLHRGLTLLAPADEWVTE